jgi:plastocyanin
MIALVGCADDANDHGTAARRLEARAEEARLSPTVTVDAASDQASDDVSVVPERSVEQLASSVEPTGVVVQVLALDNTFRPDRIEVQVGDEVLWENRGLNEHDVLYVQDSTSPFGVEAARFQPGDVYTHVFTEPGEFHYYCSIHGTETVGMVGTVVVTE